MTDFSRSPRAIDWGQSTFRLPGDDMQDTALYAWTVFFYYFSRFLWFLIYIFLCAFLTYTTTERTCTSSHLSNWHLPFMVYALGSFYLRFIFPFSPYIAIRFLSFPFLYTLIAFISYGAVTAPSFLLQRALCFWALLVARFDYPMSGSLRDTKELLTGIQTIPFLSTYFLTSFRLLS